MATRQTEITVNRGGTQFQKQTTFNQTWLPAIQACMALGVVVFTVIDVAAFIWLVGPVVAFVAFWLPAVYFAWHNHANAVGLCVTLALFVFMAIVLNWTFPTVGGEEWWWPWTRAGLTLVTVAFPAIAYLLFKRYTTDLRFENLLSSVMVQRGTLHEGLVSDTIEPVPDEENEEQFGYS